MEEEKNMPATVADEAPKKEAETTEELKEQLSELKKEPEKQHLQITPEYRKLIEGCLHEADGKTPVFCHMIPGFYERTPIGKGRIQVREIPVRKCSTAFACLQLSHLSGDPEITLEELEKEYESKSGQKVKLATVTQMCIRLRHCVELIDNPEEQPEKEEKPKDKPAIKIK